MPPASRGGLYKSLQITSLGEVAALLSMLSFVPRLIIVYQNQEKRDRRKAPFSPCKYYLPREVAALLSVLTFVPRLIIVYQNQIELNIVKALPHG